MSETIYRKDYKPTPFLIDSVDLDFDLRDKKVRVKSKLSLSRNPASDDANNTLVLDGNELKLIAVSLDGVALNLDKDIIHTPDSLQIELPSDQSTLEIETEIYPDKNTALEGLYRSSGNFCTQCEAEGFRRITYFLDRPDVMSRYNVRMVADVADCPVLLCNGNKVAEGVLENNSHWVQWSDPHPKPCYLFALVAGDLEHVKNTFTTASGDTVGLYIYTEKHNIDKCDHAMQSLIASMKWDEEVYGLEYDLDNYYVVAVDDFNMGAMENKGLNIFNSKYVLADQQTATDTDFQGIESVIAHEYFHNWSGNRVTCRDWFQLSLKEGLTVFRDQQFSSDMNSAAVKRIEDVRRLRNHQFPEDAGPMAHPIRPDEYVEINNFYTLTVYEKGAEVIRMLHTILGPKLYRDAIDLYFKRHDGSAVTCEDFVQSMEDASGVDLQQFRHWYSQSGTPRVRVVADYNETAQTYSLTFTQEHPFAKPFHIPFALALLDAQGAELPLQCDQDSNAPNERLLHLTEKQTLVSFNNIPSRPVPSLLRNFTAPVILQFDYQDSELAFLLATDKQAFTRWEAGQQLASRQIERLAQAYASGQQAEVDSDFIDAYRKVLSDQSIDHALCAEIFNLPSIEAVAEKQSTFDIDNLHRARSFLQHALATDLQTELASKLEGNNDTTFSVDAASVGRRALQNTCLSYLLKLDDEQWRSMAAKRYDTSNNMTDRMASLKALLNKPDALSTERLQQFYDQFQDQRLVIDKWFALQATVDNESVAEQVRALSQHVDFDLSNPNRVRSLVGSFAAGNPVHFHHVDGAGYEFLTDILLQLDQLNPQVAARLANPLIRWQRFDSGRQSKMRDCLAKIADSGPSRDLGEIVSKSLQ